MRTHFRLPSLSIFYWILLTFSWGGLGCEDEPPVALKIEEGASNSKATPDASTIPEVPQAATDIFKDLPYPPAQILRKPGDAVGNLRTQLPKLTKDTTSPRFLTEYRTNGPFTTIVYQLDKELREVEAVSATFHPAYRHPDQHKYVRAQMEELLGKGEKIYERHKKGQVWRNLDYRIELHIDKMVDDLVLLFHKRGHEDLRRLKQSIR